MPSFMKGGSFKHLEPDAPINVLQHMIHFAEISSRNTQRGLYMCDAVDTCACTLQTGTVNVSFYFQLSNYIKLSRIEEKLSLN